MGNLVAVEGSVVVAVKRPGANVDDDSRGLDHLTI
jgi:hypothetical protein